MKRAFLTLSKRVLHRKPTFPPNASHTVGTVQQHHCHGNFASHGNFATMAAMHLRKHYYPLVVKPYLPKFSLNKMKPYLPKFSLNKMKPYMPKLSLNKTIPSVVLLVLFCIVYSYKNKNKNKQDEQQNPSKKAEEAESIDWRLLGAVTPVKNQRRSIFSFNSLFLGCWAFAVVGAVEAINQISTGELVVLSEQHLIDCDPTNLGCRFGGIAFDFVMWSGLAHARDYPYIGRKQKCDKRELRKAKFVSIDGYGYVQPFNEEELKKTLATQPVAVTISIDTETRDFYDYKSGVFRGPCGSIANHAMLLIGYGTTEEGEDYWIAKNSYGPDWGEQGCMRLKRNVKAKEGLCGLATLPRYPIKDSPTNPDP